MHDLKRQLIAQKVIRESPATSLYPFVNAKLMILRERKFGSNGVYESIFVPAFSLGKLSEPCLLAVGGPAGDSLACVPSPTCSSPPSRSILFDCLLDYPWSWSSILMLVPAMRSSSVCQLHHSGASLDCRVRQWLVPSLAVASTNSQPLAVAICARDGGLGGAAIWGCCHVRLSYEPYCFSEEIVFFLS